MLRAGLWNLPPEGSCFEHLTDDDWAEIIDQARAHSVQALIADGLGLVPESSRPSLQKTAALALATEAVEQGNCKVEAVLKQMAAFWAKQGVTAVLLKGQGLAGMYAIPKHRTPGDIDWYFPGEENYSKALSLVRSKGFDPKEDSDGDCHYGVGGVLVEHHKRWCNLSSPFKQRSVAIIEKQYGYSQGQDYTIPAPLTNLVQLNVHILKHMLVLGVGWRQFCDLAIATGHYSGRYSTEDYRNAIESLGLMRWTRLLYGVLAKFLGVDPASLPVEPVTGKDVDRLAELIMRCGNFGRASGKGMLASYMASASLLFRYAPGEVLWRPARLARNRLDLIIKRKRD